MFLSLNVKTALEGIDSPVVHWTEDGFIDGHQDEQQYDKGKATTVVFEEEEEYVWDEMFLSTHEPSFRDNLDQLIKDMSDLESYLDKVERDTMELHEDIEVEDDLLQAFIDLKDMKLQSPTKNCRYKRREAFLNYEADIQKGVTHVHGVEVAKCKDLDSPTNPLTEKLVSIGDLDRPPDSNLAYTGEGNYAESNTAPAHGKDKHFADVDLACVKDRYHAESNPTGIQRYPYYVLQ